MTVAVQRPVRCSAKDRPSHCKVGAKGVHSLQKIIMTRWPLQCKGLPFAVQSGSRRGPLQCKGLSIAFQKVACCSARCDWAGRFSGGRERRAPAHAPASATQNRPTPRQFPSTPLSVSPSAQHAYSLTPMDVFNPFGKPATHLSKQLNTGSPISPPGHWPNPMRQAIHHHSCQPTSH